MDDYSALLRGPALTACGYHAEYAGTNKTHGTRRAPKNARPSIPVDKIYEDGIWRSGDVYSQMWSVSDINYNMLSDAKKQEIQTLYGAVYAGIPADCWAKFCIVSQRMLLF